VNRTTQKEYITPGTDTFEVLEEIFHKKRLPGSIISDYFYERTLKRLVNLGFVKQEGNYFVITPEGEEHYLEESAEALEHELKRKSDEKYIKSLIPYLKKSEFVVEKVEPGVSTFSFKGYFVLPNNQKFFVEGLYDPESKSEKVTTYKGYLNTEPRVDLWHLVDEFEKPIREALENAIEFRKEAIDSLDEIVLEKLFMAGGELESGEIFLGKERKKKLEEEGLIEVKSNKVKLTEKGEELITSLLEKETEKKTIGHYIEDYGDKLDFVLTELRRSGNFVSFSGYLFLPGEKDVEVTGIYDLDSDYFHTFQIYFEKEFLDLWHSEKLESKIEKILKEKLKEASKIKTAAGIAIGKESWSQRFWRF